MSAPEELNLSDAAVLVVAATTVGGSADRTAVLIWCALTGLPEEEALAYAHSIILTPARAAVIPF